MHAFQPAKLHTDMLQSGICSSFDQDQFRIWTGDSQTQLVDPVLCVLRVNDMLMKSPLKMNGAMKRTQILP